jgi:hypothetical protein
MKRASLKPLPVGHAVYHAIAELNRSLEETSRSLDHLVTFPFFRRDCLRAYQAMIEEVRSLANEELIESLHPRELQNTFYYERLRLQWEKQFRESSSEASVTNDGRTTRTKKRKAVRQ